MAGGRADNLVRIAPAVLETASLTPRSSLASCSNCSRAHSQALARAPEQALRSDRDHDEHEHVRKHRAVPHHFFGVHAELVEQEREHLPAEELLAETDEDRAKHG